MTCCGVDLDISQTFFPNDLLPVPDNTWSLGDATHRWKQLFLGDSPVTISGAAGFLAGNTVGLIRMDNDNKVLVLSGSDAASDVGGAYIVVAGDGSGRTGQVQIFGSSTAVGAGAGDIDLHCMGALSGVTVWTQNLQRWSWNAAGDLVQNSTDGANLVIQRAGYGALIGSSTLPDATILSAFGTYPALLSITNPNSYAAGVFGAFGANSAGPQLSGFKTRSASSSAPATTIVQAGDNLLTVSGYGSDGVDYKIGGSITFQASGTPGVNSISTDILLQVVKAGQTSQSQLARFISNGTFLIGSASAVDSDITGAWSNVPFLLINNNNTQDALINLAVGNNAVGAHFYGAKTRSSAGDANTIVVTGDELTNHLGYGADGVVYRVAAGTKIFVEGAPASNVMPGRWEVLTTNTSGLLRRYYVDSVGDFYGDSTNSGNFWLPNAKPGTKTFALGVSSVDSDVSGAFGTPGLLIVGNNNTADNAIFLANGANTAGSHIYGVKTRSSGSDANTAVVAGDQIVAFSGYGSDGTVYRNVGGITMSVAAALGSRIPSKMELITSSTGGTATRLTIDEAGILQYNTAANESTGAGTALLGTNSPAITNTAPYTWIKLKTSDGSTVYMPVWK